ncbi:MAG: hypothetical protein J0L84_02285 [Verrucomicrobia bacterium]|nr:hypothetical protein [Verrucomicrobiota bacterium]
MEVDHFDPRQKEDVVQDYFNLLLSTRHCNLAKSSYWPGAVDRKCGLRLLDPTREMDWGVHVVEDPKTHLLWGRTPAGNLHIRRLHLNARHLVDERRDRGRILRLLAEQPVKLKSVQFEVPEALPELRRQLESMIRFIPQEPMPEGHPFRLALFERRG